MADNERIDRVIIKYETDLAAIRRVKTSSTLVRSSMDFVAQMAKQVDLASGKAGKSIRDAFSSQTNNRIGQFKTNLDKSKDSVDNLRKSFEQATKAKEQLSAAQLADERFGAISRDVGVIGDVESSLRGAGVSGILPDVIGMAEALPRLKVGIQGLPAQLDAAAEALGTTRSGFVGGVGLAAIGLVGFQLIANQFAADMERIRAANQLGIDNATEYYNVISTGSPEAIKAAIKQKETQQLTNASLIASFENILRLTDEANAAWDPQNNAAAAQLNDELAKIGITADEFDAGQMRDEIKRLKGETEVGATQLQNYRNALANVNDEVAQAAQLEAGIKAIVEQRRFEFDAVMLSTDQIKQRQAAIKDEMTLLELEIQTRTAQGQNVDELTAKWAALGQQEVFLADTATKLATAREKEAEAAKFQEQQLKDIISAQNKYTSDVASIEQRSLEQRAALAERYNEALANAAEAAADAAEKALEGLQDKRAVLAASFAQDETNAQQKAQLDQLDSLIDFQRDEARALRQHQRDILQIRRDAARQEEDLIANRDFAGLFRLRRDTGRQIEDSNRDFNAERDEQAQAFRDRLQDQITQYARERDERAIKFQQDLADAQAQYQKELALADINRRKALDKANKANQDDLRALANKTSAEQTLKRSAYQADLQLIGQAAQVRQQILQAELDQARRILASLTAQSSGGIGGGGRGRAYGGALSRGQISRVNEVRPESFTTAGKTYDFPRSAGVFMANQAGKVNSRAGGGNVLDMDVNISGNTGNPEAIWRALEPKITRLLERYFGAA